MLRVQLKERAKELLKGRWFEEGLIVLVYSLISYGANVILEKISSPLSFLATLALVPMGFGYARHLLLIAREKEHGGVSDLFYYYSNGETWEVIVLALMVGFITFLYSLLLLIPGIIVSYSYILYQNLKIDYPELTEKEIRDLSKKIMSGHKWEYFIISLSFIGWGFLAGMTIIGLPLVVVYAGLTMTLYYEERLASYRLYSEEQ